MTSGRLVLGVTGMAGSGKSVVVNLAAQNGYETVVMGDEVRREAVRRGMELNPENLGKAMLELRRLEGETVVARRCIVKMGKMPSEKIVVDGIRSLAEVEEFKKHFPSFALVAVHSSPEARFRRLYRRHRSDDPEDWKIFRERDLRELGVGLGNAIAMAEHIIVNEGEFRLAREEARRILREVETKWAKQSSELRLTSTRPNQT